MRWVRPRDRALLGGACVVLLAALTAFTLRIATGAYDRTYDVHAQLSRAGQNLDTESEVRLRGISVGRVAAVELDDQDRPLITLRMDEGVVLPAETTVVVEALSLFGPQIVALHPDEAASEGRTLRPGAVLTEAQPVTELQDLLPQVHDVVTAVDPDELRNVLATAADVAEDLAPRTPALLGAAATITGVAHRNLDRGTRLLTDLTAIGRDLAGRMDQLDRVVEDTEALLPVVLDRRDQLPALLIAAGDTFDVVSQLLERHPDALSELTRSLLPSLLPPVAALAGDLRSIPPFLETLTVLFGELGSVFHLEGTVGQRLGAIELHITPDPCELIDVLPCPGDRS